jgi:hypothetical protein
MKRGHVTGEKAEKPGAGDWYRAREAELIRQVERAQAVQLRPEDSAAYLHGQWWCADIEQETLAGFSRTQRQTFVEVLLTDGRAAFLVNNGRILDEAAQAPRQPS